MESLFGSDVSGWNVEIVGRPPCGCCHHVAWVLAAPAAWIHRRRAGHLRLTKAVRTACFSQQMCNKVGLYVCVCVCLRVIWRYFLCSISWDMCVCVCTYTDILSSNEAYSTESKKWGEKTIQSTSFTIFQANTKKNFVGLDVHGMIVHQIQPQGQIVVVPTLRLLIGLVTLPWLYVKHHTTTCTLRFFKGKAPKTLHTSSTLSRSFMSCSAAWSSSLSATVLDRASRMACGEEE